MQRCLKLQQWCTLRRPSQSCARIRNATTAALPTKSHPKSYQPPYSRSHASSSSASEPAKHVQQKERHLNLGFIGGGLMASALLKSFLQSSLISSSSKITVSEPQKAQYDRLLQTCSGSHVENIIEIVDGTEEAAKDKDVVFICVHPHNIESALSDLQSIVHPPQVVASIAAGVTVGYMETFLPKVPIVRIMPNSPALVGQSSSVYCIGRRVRTDQQQTIQELLESLGIVFEVSEDLLDAVTGLSGSGPAYVYIMIDAMVDGGVRAGLSREMALKLAANTVLGAAKMVLETNSDLATLRGAVTSPAGSTISGIHALERCGFRGSIIDAVFAAANRSKEIGRSKSEERLRSSKYDQKV